MRRGTPLPADVEQRLATLGAVLDRQPPVRFAYVLNDAPTAFLGRTLQTRRVIADNAPFLRHRFESLALRKFLDFRIFEQRLLDARFARG